MPEFNYASADVGLYAAVAADKLIDAKLRPSWRAQKYGMVNCRNHLRVWFIHFLEARKIGRSEQDAIDYANEGVRAGMSLALWFMIGRMLVTLAIEWWRLHHNDL